MNLIVDQGNTKIKLAVFSGEERVETYHYDRWEVADIVRVLQKYKIERAIYSSVAKTDDQVIEYMCSTIPYFINFDHSTPVPLEIEYRTPDTLGLDRIAGCVGAMSQSKETLPFLVIDAGTAITYDLVLKGTVFSGGNIAPGMMMRFKALNQFTGRLPLVSPQEELLPLGNDTHTAIRAGVIMGIIYEIEGYIASLKIKYPSLLIFLTGGDAKLFAAKLKTPIFVDANLVIKGLNRILIYNVKK